MKKFVLASLVLTAFSSHAMTIDTLLKVADKNGSGVFSIFNNLEQPSFIKVQPSKVTITPQGTVERTPYTAENLALWEVAVTQNKLILEPHREKKIGIRALCAEGCDRSKDSVFAVKFLPTPYVKEGGKQQNSVEINYGYEPIFVIPAKEPKYQYEITKSGSKITINNKSNSFIKVLVNQCKENNITPDCSKKIIALAGRKRTEELPTGARDSSVNIKVTGYTNKYFKKYALSDHSSITER